MHKSQQRKKTVRISHDAYEFLSAFGDEFGLDHAELIEAMTYGLAAQAVVIPGRTKARRWSGFRVLEVNGEIVIQAIQASSLPKLAEELHLYCDCCN